MSWESFCSSFKKAVGTAADKINQTTDLATLQVKLGVAEHKLNEAYAQFGRAAYRHFTTEEGSVDKISKGLEQVEAAQKAVRDLEIQIEQCKSSSGATAEEASDASDTSASKKAD
ncbi:MAG: hypothetical protein E7666_09150 [Ruminococcaceae bacterium]|nr:hypothetical protein [Oscillospiraceae bacterium]